MFHRAGVQTQGIFLKLKLTSQQLINVHFDITAVLVKVWHFASLQPFLGGSCSVNQISGKISVGDELLATVDGHWVRAFIPQAATSVSLLSSSVSISLCHLFNGTERVATFCGIQDSEVFIHEKRLGQQETLWNPTPDIRSSRLKRQVVQIDQQGEFESER